MKKQITLQQYRNIDLSILLLVQTVSQWVIYKASTVWFADQLFIVSPVAAVAALVMMRWGGYAAVHAVLGGAFYALIAGGQWQHMLIYGLGNLLCMAALAMLKLVGRERIRKDALLAMIFALLIQFLMQAGRSAVAGMLGYSVDACIGYLTTDILSGLFSMVIVWCIRKADGLFEDQKQYLLRIQQERSIERGERF